MLTKKGIYMSHTKAVKVLNFKSQVLFSHIHSLTVFAEGYCDILFVRLLVLCLSENYDSYRYENRVTSFVLMANYFCSQNLQICALEYWRFRHKIWNVRNSEHV